MLHSTTATDFDLFSLAVVLKGKEGDGSVAGEDGLIAPRHEGKQSAAPDPPPPPRDPRAALEGYYIRAGRHCNDLGEESV